MKCFSDTNIFALEMRQLQERTKAIKRIISNTGTWGGTFIESNNIIFNLKNNKTTHIYSGSYVG